MSTSKKINRRGFIKTCTLGLGGCVCGADHLHALMPKGRLFTHGFSSEQKLWKWSKEALFYEKTEGGLLCKKCPHGCVIPEGDTGRCRNRTNVQGTLYTTVYGNPCAVHIDPIEKKPMYHFLPSTKAFSIAAAGCNFRCLNCQNWQISQVGPEETENVDLFPEAVVQQCIKSGCESIAYTYSEPTTFFEYAHDTARIARSKNIHNIWKSNGFINEQPLRVLSKVIDGANIDLKCFEDSIYRKLNGGELQPVLRTLQVLKEEGVWLEITNLVIPGWTDDLGMIDRMCRWLYENKLYDCPLHLSRFTPMYKLAQLPVTPQAVIEKARDIALNRGMRYVYVGNLPGHEGESTFCHRCHKKIIDRRGYSILANDIVNGRCRFCSERIPGIWR